MSTVESRPLVGAGVSRVDGPRKVTGTAPYPMDFGIPGQAYGTVVQSTVAAGRIVRMHTRAAEGAPGVLAVITHENIPSVGTGPMTALGPSSPPPLRNDRILHHGQHIAFVVAETPNRPRRRRGWYGWTTRWRSRSSTSRTRGPNRSSILGRWTPRAATPTRRSSPPR